MTHITAWFPHPISHLSVNELLMKGNHMWVLGISKHRKIFKCCWWIVPTSWGFYESGLTTELTSLSDWSNNLFVKWKTWMWFCRNPKVGDRNFAFTKLYCYGNWWKIKDLPCQQFNSAPFFIYIYFYMSDTFWISSVSANGLSTYSYL